MRETDAIGNARKIQTLIEMFGPDRRPAVESMMNDLGEEFLTAPASAREDYHNAFPGGLADHSLRVVANLWRLQKDLCPDRWPKEKLAFVGLFHDLGKCGVDGKPRYTPNDNTWQRTNWGKIYTINPELEWMTIDDATMYNLQRYGIVLDSEEYLAIRLADGMYEESNRQYAMREPDLGLLLHWADNWATREEKRSVSQKSG